MAKCRVRHPFQHDLSCAVTSDREHAWISEQALRQWPQLTSEAWWQDGLSNMIAAVQEFGWIDNANHSIRAHIDYAP
jgi:hypothetical protein